MLNNLKRLAKREAAPVVVFDLEHTGGAKETRAITEFAAYIVHPDERVQYTGSLVRPGRGAVFNPHVTRITGLTPRALSSAPSWKTVAQACVLPYRDAIWVGFNSAASDVPILIEECARHGLDFPTPARHLDTRRMSSWKGNLAEQVARWVLGLDTDGAHRAGKDALMTLWLCESLLAHMSLEEIAAAMRPGTPVANRVPQAPVIALPLRHRLPLAA